MFCTKCGAKLDEGAKFCVQCGTKVDETASAPVQPEAAAQTPAYQAPPIPPENPAQYQQAPVQQAYQQAVQPQKPEREKPLYTAFVIGICWTILGIVIMLFYNMYINISADSENSAGNIIFVTIGLYIATLVINYSGWMHNKAERSRAAGFLYLLSVNIPSAVLCFLGSAALRKRIPATFPQELTSSSIAGIFFSILGLIYHILLNGADIDDTVWGIFLFFILFGYELAHAIKVLVQGRKNKRKVLFIMGIAGIVLYPLCSIAVDAIGGGNGVGDKIFLILSACEMTFSIAVLVQIWKETGGESAGVSWRVWEDKSARSLILQLGVIAAIVLIWRWIVIALDEIARNTN